jgi:hypothetical protein
MVIIKCNQIIITFHCYGSWTRIPVQVGGHGPQDHHGPGVEGSGADLWSIEGLQAREGHPTPEIRPGFQNLLTTV